MSKTLYLASFSTIYDSLETEYFLANRLYSNKIKTDFCQRLIPRIKIMCVGLTVSRKGEVSSIVGRIDLTVWDFCKKANHTLKWEKHKKYPNFLDTNNYQKEENYNETLSYEGYAYLKWITLKHYKIILAFGIIKIRHFFYSFNTTINDLICWQKPWTLK